MRIAKATATFSRLRSCLWKRSDVSMKTKMRIYRATVIPTLLYASETWRILESDLRRLEAFQMRTLSEIASLRLSQRVPNTIIRKTCDDQPTIKMITRRSRLKWFGHVCRMPDGRLPVRLLTTRIPGTWRVHRSAPKKMWLNSIHDDLIHLKEAYGAAAWHRQWFNLVVDQAQRPDQWLIVTSNAVNGQPTAHGRQRRR